MAFDPLAYANQAAQTAPDMNKAKTFEDKDFPIPAAGLARLRLVDYIELGTHQEEYNGKPKTVEKVRLTFELSGPRHQPIKTEDGKLIPQIIGFTINKSLTDKSKFYKLFLAMNYDKSATHMAQLLGKAFLGTVVHKKVGEGTPDEKTYANLQNENGYTIRSTLYEDPDTGEARHIVADPPLSPLRIFIWEIANKDMWDCIFIDGTWPDKKDEKTGEILKKGESKNYFQNYIKKALDFKGSPAAACCLGEIDVPGAEAPERKEEDIQASADAKAGASQDPLAGL